MIDCVVVGTDHRLQSSDTALKAHLAHLARNHNFGLVAEECAADASTVAGQVASSLGVPHLPIDMTDAERKEAGIYDRLCIRPKMRFDPASGYQEEHVYLRHADGVRENFWLDKIEAITCEGQVLVVCGYLHLDPLSEKARRRRHRVTKTVFPEDLPGRIRFEVLD